MRTQEQFDNYFTQAQRLSVRANVDKDVHDQLLQLIDYEKDTSYQHFPYNDFLQGEYFFYRGQFQEALKSYLLAKSIPYFKLFCYRTSAYISKERGEIFKSINFARHALEIYPFDFPSLAILEELLTLDQQPEEALEIREIIRTLETPTLDSPPKDASSVETTSTMESTMLSSTSFLTPPHCTNDNSLEHLTQRLYTMIKEPPGCSIPFSKFATPSKETTQTFHHQVPPIDSLEQAIKSFHLTQTGQVSQYLNLLKTRSKIPDQCFYVLQGLSANTSQPHLQFTEWSQKTSGGYFFRWNGKGIAINPGKSFLEHFHLQGLHVRDIDTIIVTNANTDAYTEIKEIYNLNYLLNKEAGEIHVIQFFLIQSAHQTLSAVLKPNFKQERNTVHSLEIFDDSPEIERIEVNDKVILNYFQTSTDKENKSNLGIRLDLLPASHENEEQPIYIGYISEAKWSTQLTHLLGPCNILIAGFGHTNSLDYTKQKYNDDSLGYYGCYSLIEGINPKLFLCSEFSGKDGDIRLEIVKLLRHELSHMHPKAETSSIILPAAPNLLIDLKTLYIQCSLTKSTISPSQVLVAKSSDPFGKLHFLAPCSFT